MAGKKKITRKQLKRGVRLRGGSSQLLSVPPLTLLPLIDMKMHVSMTAPAMVVTKPYTAQERTVVVLRSTRRFVGHGLFACASADVEFFISATGGTALKFDGTDNRFDPRSLNKGVKLFAQANKPGEAEFTLELHRQFGKPRTVKTKLFLVELTLDICEPRTGTGNPVLLGQPPANKPSGTANDKFFGGRPLVMQDEANAQERAMLIVQPVKPTSFRGKLTLTRINDRVETFSDETFVKGKSSRAADFVIESGSIPADGERNFVQATKTSASLRDTGYRLGLTGVAKEGDIIRLSCIEAKIVSNVEEKDLHLVERVPEKPARKTSSKFMPGPRIIGVKHPIELGVHLTKVTAAAHQWSTTAANISLNSATKEVVKLEATANSSAEDDVIIENVMSTDHGKMKLVQKMTAVTAELGSVVSGDTLTSSDDINVIKNPAGCVILNGADASDPKKVPVYVITKLTPNLIWTANDDRIAWWIRGGHGDYLGKAKFMAPDSAKRGLQVQIHGTHEKDVLIQPYSGGFGFGMLRSHVVTEHEVKFRVSRVLFAGNPSATPPIPARAPQASVADAKSHIKVANLYLRQAGIELVPDNSAEIVSPTGNNKIGRSALDARVVSATRHSPGFFDIVVNRATLTFKAPQNRSIQAVRINARNEVFTFAYIHSQPTAGALAAVMLWPVNHAPKARHDPPRAYTRARYTLEDKGTPSSSLTSKTGLPGDTPATPVKLVVIVHDSDTPWLATSPTTRNRRLQWGIIVPTHTIENNATAGGLAKELVYGNTIAHEVGHILGLGHRGDLTDGFTDGLTHPVDKNLMDPDEPPPDAEDLDIVQVKAIRFSEILHRTP